MIMVYVSVEKLLVASDANGASAFFVGVVHGVRTRLGQTSGTVHGSTKLTIISHHIQNECYHIFKVLCGRIQVLHSVAS